VKAEHLQRQRKHEEEKEQLQDELKWEMEHLKKQHAEDLDVAQTDADSAWRLTEQMRELMDGRMSQEQKEEFAQLLASYHKKPVEEERAKT